VEILAEKLTWPQYEAWFATRMMWGPRNRRKVCRPEPGKAGGGGGIKGKAPQVRWEASRGRLWGWLLVRKGGLGKAA
jgi:hypothetical protein